MVAAVTEVLADDTLAVEMRDQLQVVMDVGCVNSLSKQSLSQASAGTDEPADQWCQPQAAAEADCVANN